MGASLVPAVDPAGLPGPPWLFHVLLVFTFVLHVLFMNLVLGGSLLAWVSHLRSGRAGDANDLLARRLMGVNAFAISIAITAGIAPLLFIQVLYQRFFYAGTILLGWRWFGLVVLLTLGYYAAYLYKFGKGPGRGGLWLGVSAILFLAIATIQVAVALLHVQPDLWLRSAAHPLAVLGDPTYVPRFLHFVLAGIAFSALVMAWWAIRRVGSGQGGDMESSIARTCWRWALWATALQVADGFLFLMVLPKEVLFGMMKGGVATLGPLTLAIVLAMGLLVMLARSLEPAAHRGLVTGTLAATVLTVAVMAVTRHQVRVLYLDAVPGLAPPTVAPQWGNFLLFVVLLVVAIATVAYMVRRVFAEPASGEEAA